MREGPSRQNGFRDGGPRMTSWPLKSCCPSSRGQRGMAEPRPRQLALFANAPCHSLLVTFFT